MTHAKLLQQSPEIKLLLMSRLEPQMHRQFCRIIIKEDTKYHFMTPDGEAEQQDGGKPSKM